jgi:tetratricopeptide (TPR) repeat protein
MITIIALALAGAFTDPRSYEACAALTETDPAKAQVYAERWIAEGGGRPARHCAAIAALGLGAPASAGALLSDLAVDEAADPAAAARLYLQAGEAFMQAGRRDQAFAALRAAYEAVPDAAEVHMAAATIYAAGEEWEGVILTLNALERHADLSADAYALRGRAQFNLGRVPAAARDTVRALSLDPLLVDALVLRGDVIEAGVALPYDPFAAGP